MPNSAAHDAFEDPIAEAYNAYYTLLVSMAVERFGVSEGDAQALAHDVFVAFMAKIGEVRDARSWLVGAICNASRYHCRLQRRVTKLPKTFSETATAESREIRRTLPDQVSVRQTFACLAPRCQFVLHLRYWAEYTVPEIARELGTTPGYAAKVISKCLRAAERQCGIS